MGWATEDIKIRFMRHSAQTPLETPPSTLTCTYPPHTPQYPPRTLTTMMLDERLIKHHSHARNDQPHPTNTAILVLVQPSSRARENPCGGGGRAGCLVACQPSLIGRRFQQFQARGGGGKGWHSRGQNAPDARGQLSALNLLPVRRGCVNVCVCVRERDEHAFFVISGIIIRSTLQSGVDDDIRRVVNLVDSYPRTPSLVVSVVSVGWPCCAKIVNAPSCDPPLPPPPPPPPLKASGSAPTPNWGREGGPASRRHLVKITAGRLADLTHCIRLLSFLFLKYL